MGIWHLFRNKRLRYVDNSYSKIFQIQKKYAVSWWLVIKHCEGDEVDQQDDQESLTSRCSKDIISHIPRHTFWFPWEQFGSLWFSCLGVLTVHTWRQRLHMPCSVFDHNLPRGLTSCFLPILPCRTSHSPQGFVWPTPPKKTIDRIEHKWWKMSFSTRKH